METSAEQIMDLKLPQPTRKTPQLVKKQPDVLCNCPQKCGDRVPNHVKTELYKEFSLLGDHYRQNLFLQSYIEMRSVYKRLWCQEERVGGRLQRRVSCKYKIPLSVPQPILPNETLHEPKLATNSKGKMTYFLGTKSTIETVEVCQKAFMNMYGVTEKRIRLQREKLIARLRSDGALKGGPDLLSQLNHNDSNSTSKTRKKNCGNFQSQLINSVFPPTMVDYDIAIVDNFFQNQLWKPEYIGISGSISLPGDEVKT